MFPTGLPGAALFLLRFGVMGMLFDSIFEISSSGNISPWKIAALALVSLLLMFGAFTPVASFLSLIFDAICWPAWGGIRSFEFSLQAVVIVALFVLGPGAYSIDSKMFGRRLILPPE